MKNSKLLIASITFSIWLLSAAGARAIVPRLLPTTNNPIDLAIQTTSCDNDTDCLIPDYKVRLLRSTPPFLSARIQVLLDDTGSHFDFFPGSAKRRVENKARHYARQFIRGLCYIQNGRPDDVRVDFISTKDERESGQSYNRAVIAHMSTFDRDSYTFTLQTIVKCLNSRP